MASPLNRGRFKAIPPEKGSFPIDHDGVCKDFMVKYMKCLQTSGRDAGRCRKESMDYLECRMSNQLMDRDSWEGLGYADLATQKTPQIPKQQNNEG